MNARVHVHLCVNHSLPNGDLRFQLIVSRNISIYTDFHFQLYRLWLRIKDFVLCSNQVILFVPSHCSKPVIKNWRFGGSVTVCS
jgi:hypothetical protein